MFKETPKFVSRFFDYFSEESSLRRQLLRYMLEHVSDFRDYNGTLKFEHGKIDFDASQFLAYNCFRSLMGELIKEIVKPYAPDALGATGDRAKVIAMDASESLGASCEIIMFKEENILIHEDDHDLEAESTEEVIINKKIIVVSTYYNDSLIRSIVEAERQGYQVVAAISLFGWKREYLKFKKDFSGRFPFISVFSMDELMPLLLDEAKKKPKKSPFRSKKSRPVLRC